MNDRSDTGSSQRPQTACAGGTKLRPGDRVRLRPQQRADAVDLVLAGRTATITAIEHDFEDRVYFAVTIDDDPGRDLGPAGWPGHRFFFRPDELEPLPGADEVRQAGSPGVAT